MAGEIFINRTDTPTAESERGWRVHCVPLDWDEAPRAPFRRTEVGSNARMAFRRTLAGPCRLELEIQSRTLEWTRVAILQVRLAAEQTLMLDVDLASRTLSQPDS